MTFIKFTKIVGPGRTVPIWINSRRIISVELDRNGNTVLLLNEGSHVTITEEPSEVTKEIGDD